MGILLEEQPSITDLYTLINKVPKFPISVKKLTDIAKKEKTPKAVVDFYRAFPEDGVFDDKDDLISRTESIEILHHQTAPQEEMHAPEED